MKVVAREPEAVRPATAGGRSPPEVTGADRRSAQVGSDPESEAGRSAPVPGRARYPFSLVSRTSLGPFQGHTFWQICRLTRFRILLRMGARRQ
jgi:hypothetical protein